MLVCIIIRYSSSPLTEPGPARMPSAARPETTVGGGGPTPGPALFSPSEIAGIAQGPESQTSALQGEARRLQRQVAPCPPHRILHPPARMLSALVVTFDNEPQFQVANDDQQHVSPSYSSF